MKRITVGKLFELYIDTLEKCDENTKKLSHKMIEYNIFEEFIVGVTSFMAQNSLDNLLDNGLIDDNIYADSELLRKNVLILDGTSQWNVQSFKSTESWNQIIQLSDSIKYQIQQRWSKQELKEIFEM